MLPDFWQKRTLAHSIQISHFIDKRIEFGNAEGASQVPTRKLKCPGFWLRFQAVAPCLGMIVHAAAPLVCPFSFKKQEQNRGAWVAQSVECPTSARVLIPGSWDQPPCQALCWMWRLIKILKNLMGHLGGSVGWASDFGSGHDLTVCGFEPRVWLCTDSVEPAGDSHALSLSYNACCRSYPFLIVSLHGM